MSGKSTEQTDVHEEFEELATRYKNFIRPFNPKIRDINLNVFYNIVNEKRTKGRLVDMARNTRPFISKEIWELLHDYMNFLKDLPGIEGRNYTAVYANFSRADFLKRLLFKRPLVFYMRYDKYLMRFNGKEMKTGTNDAYMIPKNLDQTPDSKPYLREYISYDENLMSALIGMSTPTFYVNIGAGNSRDASEKPYIKEGILCGIVGARNSKVNVMDNLFVFPRSENGRETCHQSVEFWIKNVYADAFPQGKIPTLTEIKNNSSIYKSIYIDGINVVYLEKRLKFSILPYIMEAASRGHENKRNILCSVPPIGGGVWSGKVKGLTISQLIVKIVLNFLEQNDDFENLKYLKALYLPQININYYELWKAQGNIKNLQVDDSKITLFLIQPANHKIRIFNNYRYVAELMPEGFEDCLCVAGYAWDGNSYPGNEYWVGGMKSFDPQAIYCSLLGQFQNPEVNIKMADEERIRIY